MPTWLPIVASLIGGGACGAVLKVVYDNWRERKQPVVYQPSIDSVFSSAPHAGALQARAQVTHDGREYPFESLSLVRIEIKNKGNRDINPFPFGITLEGPHEAVLCVTEGDDRHHQIAEVDPPATPENPRSTIDLVCTPFNRKDHYTVRLYVRNEGAVKPDQIKLSTAIPIRFARVQSVDEQVPTTIYGKFAVVIGTIAAVFSMLAFASSDIGNLHKTEHPLVRVEQIVGPDGKTAEFRVTNVGSEPVRITAKDFELNQETGDHKKPPSTQRDASK